MFFNQKGFEKLLKSEGLIEAFNENIAKSNIAMGMIFKAAQNH